MITHTLYGGLGNQLFQIFTVISLSLKSGHEFYFELKEDSLLETSSLLSALLPFCKSAEECRALEQHLHIHDVHEPESHQYDAHCFDEIYTTSNDEYLFVLKGYFQSYLYFQDEFSEILRMLDIDKQLEKFVNIEAMPTITNKIMLHFRLGDYKNLQHTHMILPCNYYRNAIQHILDKEKSTINVVYVFQKSDQEIVEKYYIKRLSSWFPQCTWTSIYTETSLSDEQQLLYMSLTNHLVIANSSFSLWAAYLNRNRNPCICYPSTWIKNLGDDTWNVEFDETGSSSEKLCFVPHISNIIHPLILVEDMFCPSWNRIENTLDSSVDNMISTLTKLSVPMTQCLCYKNQTKKTSMIQRFETIGLPLQIYEGVSFTDPRIVNFAYSERDDVPTRDVKRRFGGEEYERKNSLSVQRLWSVTYGHLDMIQRFLDTEQPYGLFCEDDILVNRTLPDHIQNIMEECKEMQVDCLLLGYMITFKVEGWMEHYEEIQPFPSRSYRYHNYPDELWGVHMYMLSRAGALKIIETYANGYADVPNHVFSPDWTISKCPGVKRAIIYPMFAVEDGKDTMEHYNHDGQYQFHMNTFKHNYISEVFI
jgi:GR25 family glycosyltransferase involved in LPS biosynthesis